MLAVCSVQATFWWWAQPCRAETELLTCLTLACLDQGCKLCGTFSGSLAKGRRTADAGCGKGSAGQGSGPDGGRRPLTGQKTEGTLCVPSVVCDHGSCVPWSTLRWKCVAFQTIRPDVSRKKRGLPAHLPPGGAMPPPRMLPFQRQDVPGPVNTNFAHYFSIYSKSSAHTSSALRGVCPRPRFFP